MRTRLVVALVALAAFAPAQTPTNVTPVPAALLVTGFEIPAVNYSGEATTFRYTVTNVGSHPVWPDTEYWRDFLWLSADQTFWISGDTSASIGGSVSYVGERTGRFQATAVREVLPDYVQIDLRASLEHGDWTASAFVNNVTDKRALLNGGRDAFAPIYFTYIRPRSFGLSLARAF